MSTVLKNFLIGVGLDTKDYEAGGKKVESSLERMRSLVGFTGAAITGAFAAVGTGAITAGRRVDAFVLATEGFKTSRQYVYDYGNALKALGGDAGDAIAAIRGIEKAQSDLKLKGMLGPLEDVALSGTNIHALMQARDGQEFLRTLSGILPGLDKDQQRLVQDALGLTDAVMRSLRDGTEKLDASVARARELAGGLDDAVQASREFNRALAELDTRFERIGGTLAQKVLPGFTGVLDAFGGFLDTHQAAIEKAAQVAKDNPAAATLLTGAGAATVSGAALRGVGLGKLGGKLAMSGAKWGAFGAGMLATEAGLTQEALNFAAHPEDYFKPDYSALPDAPLGPEVPIVPPGIIQPAEKLHITPSATSGFVNYVPVYAGGEVSNAEVASASPDVVMIRDRSQQSGGTGMPQRFDVRSNIDLTVELDGRQIESKIVDVVERRERDAADDALATVDR